MKTTKKRVFFYPALLLLLTIGCKEDENLINEQLISLSQDIFWNDSDRFPDYNTFYKVPAGYEGNTFKLSQDYPETYNPSDYNFPWSTIDFTDKDKYIDYMNTVLKYSLEESVDNDFRIEKNERRKWYHAPWMHNDDEYRHSIYVGAGREALRGLTQEITSKPYQLHDSQINPAQTWAIAFYNEPGGYTFGKIWKKGEDPDINQSNFPEGTVCYKLIFTDASIEEVPFLKGTLEWDAHIYDNTNKDSITGKVVNKVRLLQLDIAVKDSRAKDTEWALGTFIYNNAKKGEKWYDKLEPVGLSWGNDFDEREQIDRFPNNFINPKLKESVVNKSLIKEASSKENSEDQAYVTHLGVGGRMNGPVDNMRSSCISCHSRAALDKDFDALDIADFSKNPYDDSIFNEFFKIVKGGVQIISYNDKDYTTADFSFQVSIGIRNYQNNLNILKAIPTKKVKNNLSINDIIDVSKTVKQLPKITREGLIR